MGRARAENGQATEPDDGDPDRTVGYSLGASTSDGQRFRVLRPHARGGLGAVFVALDAELHREVALKQILEKHADDPFSRARFLLEAEITGGLEHPGIVPVYGLGTYADGRPYLRDAVHQGRQPQGGHRPLPRRRGVEARPRPSIAGAAQAAAPVPRRLQRDRLRPQPRRAAPRPQAGQHHARQARRDAGGRLGAGQGDRPGRSRLDRRADAGAQSRPAAVAETLPGCALGTPAYMSPEQAAGDLERLGPRSDVYSLGATLYCLLTGRPPFEGDDVGDVLRAVQAGEFRPPRQIDPSIDRALEAVCLKAMAPQPADRYATPRALADDIERWMADEPVSGVARAALAAAAAVVAAEPDGGDRRRRWRCWRRVAGWGRCSPCRRRPTASSRGRETTANAAGAGQHRAGRREGGRAGSGTTWRCDAIRTFHTGVSEDFLLKEEKFKGLRDRLLKSAADFYGKLGGLLEQRNRPRRRGGRWRAQSSSWRS